MSTELRDQLQRTLGGGYHVEQELGGGGMSRIFAAEDESHRRVVVKVLPPELAAGVNADRFKREIRVATELHHARIVPVLNAGQKDDILFYTMPFIGEESLRTMLDREHQLPLDTAVAFARDVAEAADFAHTQNIVHRDIKPSNVLLDGGRALVTDFGIARAIEKAADIDSVTSTGLTLGTPSYMSPEQASAEKHIDGRSDIYSLGCVVYEMLAGEPPFSGANARVIIARHLTEAPPSIRIARPDVPEYVDLAIEKALAKAPAGRFRTATEFVRALENPDWTPRRAEAARRKRRRRRWVAAASAAAVMAGAGIGIRAVAGGRTEVPGLDPAKIAVLYLDAPPSDSQLVAVARGITRDLIYTLGRVQELSLISEPGIRKFGASAAIDSVARDLGVGTVVHGGIEPLGDSLRVDVRLVHGASLVETGAIRITHPRASPVALRDTVVGEVARALRRHLGSEVRLREWRAQTRSPAAWEHRQRAQVLIDHEAQLPRRARDFGPQLAVLAAAESLLALASAEDPRWVEPIIARGWVKMRQSQYASGSLAGALLDSAVTFANAALARQPGNTHALELRGSVRYARWSAVAGSPAHLLDSAEADLRAATAADARLAGAWNALSAILRMRGDYTGAIDAIRRAYAADAYLSRDAQSTNRLIFTYLFAEQNDSARALCARATRQFPEDPAIAACELNVLGWTGRGPRDVERIWISLASVERAGPWPLVGGIFPVGRFYAAAVLARSGLPDSARAVAAATRVQLREAGSPDHALLNEAQVRTLLGEHGAALDLLERAIRSDPRLRAQVRVNPWFRPLRSERRYGAIVGE